MRTNEIKTLENVECNDWWTGFSRAIEVTDFPVTIRHTNTAKPSAEKNWHSPAAALFYSEDGKVWQNANESASNGYREFSVIRSDAYGWKTEAVSYQYEIIHLPSWKNWSDWIEENRKGTPCQVTAVRYGRFAMIRMEDAGIIVHATATLPKDMEEEKLYFVLTGEKCTLSDLKYSYEDEPIGPGTIDPVVEKRTFIPTTIGDIPNIDCSGWWVQHSDGIQVTETPVRVRFHSISYPSAKETWHAPIVVLYSALDETVNGVAYKEFSVIRSDTEGWKTDCDQFAVKDSRTEDFTNWENWLAANKSGVDCSVTAYRKEDKIVIELTNNGVVTISNTLIPYGNDLPIFISLSGELCAITNIRISHG